MKHKYHRYRLTYPVSGNKIYQSRSLVCAIKKCYREYKNINGIYEGLFSVTDIDTDKIYTYKIKNKSK